MFVCVNLEKFWTGPATDSRCWSGNWKMLLLLVCRWDWRCETGRGLDRQWSCLQCIVCLI